MSFSIQVAFLNGYAPDWADAVVHGIGASFHCTACRIEIDLELDRSYAADRQQYHATLILATLLRHLPDQHSKIVGITPVDLFIPVLTFVFGQSQLDGPGAVVSTHRLRSEFYGLPGDEGKLAERTTKEAVHELGHAFGLVHCHDYLCVMHASTYVEDVDLKEASFCTDCRAALHTGRLPYDLEHSHPSHENG